MISLGTLLALSIFAPDASAAFKFWTNTDTTWPPTTESQEWFYDGGTPGSGANWGGGTLPGAGDDVYLVSATATTVYLNNPVTGITHINMNNGARLYLGSDAKLSGFTRTAAQILVGSTTYGSTRYDAELYIASGAEVRLTNSVAISLGSTLETYGTLKPTAIGLAEGMLKIAGGVVNPRNADDSANGALILGAPTGKSGIVRQTGGAVTLSGLQIGSVNVGSSTYEISGGSLSGTDNNALSTSVGGAMSGTFTLHVIGSGASGISFNGLRYSQTTDRALTTWAFTLDNSANHITPVTFTANGTMTGANGATLRDSSNLDVNLKGGVLLSGADTFTLIKRVSGTDTAWGAGPGPLWDDITGTSGTRDLIKVALAGAADKGTLNCSLNTSTSFTATDYGYLDLTNVDTGKPLDIALELGAGTLGDLTAALDDAGITWRTTSRVGADIVLTLNPAVSGDKYFAWDLSSIAGDLTIKRVWSGEPPPVGTVIAIQ